MRYGNVITISKHLNQNDKANILQAAASDIKHTNNKKSLRVIGGFKVRSSEFNSDNFVRNNISYLFEYTAYKMPRIVKNILK